jgi:hypothetical protein
MKRAAVIIGVDRTGLLQPLNDAARGAQRLHDEWAKGQKFASLKLLTDAGGKPVTAKAIKTAVEAAIKLGVGQLVVYFAGHGINRQRGEIWLLSGAPGNPQEAVNVRGSEDLARTCGIPHVVLISDACRTVAGSVLHDSVTGSEIFPNKEGREYPVDQFFACRLGMPANEAKDVKARKFRALYTDILIPALKGEVRKILEVEQDDRKAVGYVHPQPLADYLEEAMTTKLQEPQFAGVAQEPIARILSKDTAWLSMVSGIPAAPPRAAMMKPMMPEGGGGGGGPKSRNRARMKSVKKAVRRVQARPRPISMSAASSLVVRAALAGPQALDRAFVGSANAAVTALAKSTRKIAQPFGPMHQESGCGFKIRGGAIAAAQSLHGRTEMTRTPADVVRVWDLNQVATPALLELDSGSGIVLPAIRDYLCALTIEGGDLVDVAYEPVDYARRWNTYKYQADEIRQLRSFIGTASRHGFFRLEGDDALQLARRMQRLKALDPSLAIYAAYAYHDLHQQDHIEEMDKYLRRPWDDDGFGATLFDVAMFAKGGKRAKMPPPKEMMYTFCPLLSQGWAYLGSRRISLPAGLEGLERMVEDSMWTIFNAKGVALLRRNMFGRKRR